MKTIEEIRDHLTKTAYTREAVTKIMGFLIGAGLKGDDEQLFVVYGASTFEDFLEWINDDECECECCNCVLCSIINDISKRLENSQDDDEAAYYANQLAFLLEEFGLIDEDEFDID